ncbi:hypothetical protein Tco_0804504 [Tanacetum coccineum]|uniref:Uncharacterized protein n=1 Tax=Tanacetum coccineum TaxID=301880 RepID=A0ABQ5A7I1_9ASTR
MSNGLATRMRRNLKDEKIKLGMMMGSKLNKTSKATNAAELEEEDRLVRQREEQANIVSWIIFLNFSQNSSRINEVFGSILLVIMKPLMKKLEILKKNIKFRGGLLGLKDFLMIFKLLLLSTASVKLVLLVKIEENILSSYYCLYTFNAAFALEIKTEGRIKIVWRTRLLT